MLEAVLQGWLGLAWAMLASAAWGLAGAIVCETGLSSGSVKSEF